MAKHFMRILSLLLALFLTQPLFASSSQVIGNTVHGLHVRVNSTPGVDPRAQAMGEAQRLAFKAYFQQATHSDETPSFPESLPPDEELSNLVQEISIQKEKITATQYQATLDVTFKAHSLDKWLKKEEKSPPLLLTQEEQPEVSAALETPPKPVAVTKMLQAKFRAFQDWLQIQRLLERLPHLSMLNILEFSQTHGKVEVEWEGVENALEASLQNAGFVVTRASNEVWHVEKKLETLSRRE